MELKKICEDCGVVIGCTITSYRGYISLKCEDCEGIQCPDTVKRRIGRCEDCLDKLFMNQARRGLD